METVHDRPSLIFVKFFILCLPVVCLLLRWENNDSVALPCQRFFHAPEKKARQGGLGDSWNPVRAVARGTAWHGSRFFGNKLIFKNMKQVIRHS